MEISHRLTTWANCKPLNYTLKLHFQILTPPGINLIFRLQFSSFCRDTHFQDFKDLSSFRYKIKFAKCHFGLEGNIHWIYMSRFFFFFFFFCSVYIQEKFTFGLFNVHSSTEAFSNVPCRLTELGNWRFPQGSPSNLNEFPAFCVLTSSPSDPQCRCAVP